MKLSLDNCHLVINDMNRQLSASKAETEALSTSLANMRSNHKKAIKDMNEIHQKDIQNIISKSRKRNEVSERDNEVR